MDNPFLNKYETEFEIPPFSKINNKLNDSNFNFKQIKIK